MQALSRRVTIQNPAILPFGDVGTFFNIVSSATKSRVEWPGTIVDVPLGMGFRNVEDSIAYQLAGEFKREIYAIANESRRALADFKYIGQLFEAASGGESNIAEGFSRFRSKEISQFLRYGLSSMAEARVRIKDGADRGYFPHARCTEALSLGERAINATRAWHQSLQPPPEPPRRAKGKKTIQSRTYGDDTAL